MAKGYSLQGISVIDGGNQYGDGAQVNCNDKSINLIFTGAALLAQGVGAVNDTIDLYDIPAGATPAAFIFQTDTAFTGATISFGDGVTAARFGSIAAPAANTRYILDAVSTRLIGQLTNKLRVTITITGAALPAAFNAMCKLTYFVPAV